MLLVIVTVMLSTLLLTGCGEAPQQNIQPAEDGNEPLMEAEASIQVEINNGGTQNETQEYS